MKQRTLKVNFSELEDTHTPVLDYCRKILVDGSAKPDDRLELFRTREEPDLIVTNIGKAAKLTVRNTEFRKFYPKKRASSLEHRTEAVSSLVDALE